MGDGLCTVCRRRTPTEGQVCDPDRKRIIEQLAELPRKLAALTLALVPAAPGLSERVSVSRTGSPTGARLDTLNLAAAGSDNLTASTVTGMLHPHVRKWRTAHTVMLDGGEEREIVTWHQELVRDSDGQPMQVFADDQVGTLPPTQWLASWVRSWRETFGHTHPHGRGRSKTPKTPEHLAAYAQSLAARQHAANVLLGLTRGYTGAPTLHADDPLAEEWEIRFGEPVADNQPAADVDYLLTWFDKACDHEDAAVGDFAAELRALTAELTRVLGETPDQQWLGRCPTNLTDRQTGTSQPCAAGLWQDPYASQVVCPRCRSSWGPGGLALLRLAADIRRVWPVDRRRRYNTAELKQLRTAPPIRCRTCGTPAHITWREVTAAGDRERWWRPDHATCQPDCPDAGRLI
jgi:hypothetical protein